MRRRAAGDVDSRGDLGLRLSRERSRHREADSSWLADSLGPRSAGITQLPGGARSPRRATRACGASLDLGFVLVGIAGIEVEEPLAGEIIGHRLAHGSQLLEEPGVLADQSLALLRGHLEDVGIEPPSPHLVVEAPEPLDPHAGVLVLIFEHPGILPGLHLLGEGDQLGVRVSIAADPFDPGDDLLGAQPRALLGTKLLQAGDDLGGSHGALPRWVRSVEFAFRMSLERESS